MSIDYTALKKWKIPDEEDGYDGHDCIVDKGKGRGVLTHGVATLDARDGRIGT